MPATLLLSTEGEGGMEGDRVVGYIGEVRAAIEEGLVKATGIDHHQSSGGYSRWSRENTSDSRRGYNGSTAATVVGTVISWYDRSRFNGGSHRGGCGGEGGNGGGCRRMLTRISTWNFVYRSILVRRARKFIVLSIKIGNIYSIFLSSFRPNYLCNLRKSWAPLFCDLRCSSISRLRRARHKIWGTVSTQYWRLSIEGSWF